MIEVKNLKMQYGSNTIFKNFNYTFKEGTITAIMGPSGKGKTTLIRCIAGLNKYKEGEILYNGKKITKPCKDIFMMHQHYSNFPWLNCLDNVLLPIKLNGKICVEDKIKAINILKDVGLGEHLKKFPSELSGGMNQRLAFARVIMANPKVIVMDEPMSALDEKTRERLQTYLLNLNKVNNNTIIMVTHDIKEARRMASNIIEL